MGVLNIILGIVSVVGVGLTIYYGTRTARLERARKRLDYSDLQACANDLGAEINKEFKPDFCFTPGLSGATFAHLLVGELTSQLPTYVGRTYPLEKVPSSEEGKHYIDTTKWRVAIPDEIFNFTDKRVLVIDDFAMSGDFLQNLKDCLIKAGFAPENIRSATIAATRVAYKGHKGPDYVWMRPDNDDFFFPWGRAT